MALHWNVEDVKDHEEVVAEGEPWTITQALIFATITIGINEITEANAEEVFVRLSMSEAYAGQPFRSYDEDGEIIRHSWTPEMVTRRIGLRTNASTITKAKFSTNVASRLREDAERKFSKETATV